MADNTAMIQALLNAGPTVLPLGSYNVTHLNVVNNFDLNGSTIHMTAGSGSMLVIVGNNRTIRNGTLFGLYGGATPGNPAGQHAINGNADDITIDSMDIEDFAGYGITIQGNRPTITRTNVNDTGLQGIFYNAGSNDTVGGEISFCSINRSGLPSNFAEGATQPAIAIRGSGTGAQVTRYWRIHDNQIAMPSNPIDTTAECFELRHTEYCRIYQNFAVGGSIGYSIVLNALKTLLYNNVCNLQNLEGYELGNPDIQCINCFCQGLLIDGVSGVGFLIDGTADNILLQNCQTEDCQGHAVQLYHTVTNISIIKCKFTLALAGTSGIYLQQAQGVYIDQTMIDCNSLANTSGIFFDTSIGNLFMTQGFILNAARQVAVYAAAPGTTTDNLTFNCVNQPGGFVIGDIVILASGDLGPGVNIDNSCGWTQHQSIKLKFKMPALT